MTSTNAIPMPITMPRRLPGSGFATTDASGGRLLRPNAYWVRPIAMPTAASAKPQWKPHCCCTMPVRSGPKNAPRLMPR